MYIASDAQDIKSSEGGKFHFIRVRGDVKLLNGDKSKKSEKKYKKSVGYQY